ncbi:MAG: permease [Pirellulales bacterium]|nr:permease [Pirellulales bacterium]
MLELLLGGILRILQALLAASPTLLIGLFVAGILHRLLGHRRTRLLFGAGTWRELPQAWLIGMLLPVCSLGVLPVARRLRLAGLAGGTTLAFAMTAPLFNPLSLLYGLTLSEPFVIFAFALGSLAVVTVVGGLWDKIFSQTELAENEPPLMPHGWQRLAAILLAILREAAGPSLKFIFVGLLGVALLSFALKPGALQTQVEHDNPRAPLNMTMVAIPAYVTPLTAMWQLGSMFQHGNSIGAGFVLLTLGAGLNLGLILWMCVNYGWRRGLVFMVILISVVWCIAYSLEKPLYPEEVDPAGHSHAFDMYCSPFHQGNPQVLQKFSSSMAEALRSPDAPVAGLYGLLVILGGILRWVDPREIWESKLSELQPVKQQKNRFDVVLPPAALGGVALLGLVLFSVFGCYSYYPPVQACFQEMKNYELELFSAAVAMDLEQLEYHKEHLDDWTRRLQVGAYLRTGNVTDFQRYKAMVLRNKLELLEHAVAEGDYQEAKQYAQDVTRAYARLRKAFGLQ